MFHCFSKCEHPECDLVTHVAMDAFLSAPGDMMLIKILGSDICIRKRQMRAGDPWNALPPGQVGCFADLVTRCRQHATGRLPEHWVAEEKKELDAEFADARDGGNHRDPDS